ncbi:MAG: hypothetical protein ACO3UU_08020, partial [Minisyncoccia bacterium]
TDDTLGYIGTGNTSPSIEKRTHILSNGQTIWDLSGNVWEWTNNSLFGKDAPTGSPIGFNWREYTALTNYGSLSYDLVRPSNNTWNSTQNMGKIYSDGTSTNNTNYGFIRGGRGDSTGPESAGVFSVILDRTSTSTYVIIGFRCVVR